ncbi:MAG: LacI family transcriptional regulator [Victivallaceae bacterium]|nr:LacI family transcriptional regulator [Victivallaceae bacterium]
MADVNASTVSRAFNPKTRNMISEKVRERIFAIAEKHEYEPKSSARSLVTGKSFQLGIILHSLEADLSSPTMAMFLSEFCREAMRQNYQTVLLPIEDGEFDKKVVKNIRSSKADGYFIGAPLMGMQTLEELTKRHIPVATYISDNNLMYGLDKVTFIQTDDSTGYTTMFKTIKERGFDSIALFYPDMMKTHPRMRLEPIAAEYGIHVSERIKYNSSKAPVMSWQSSYQAAKKLLARIVKHQLIYCSSDLVALGLCHALSDTGIIPGKDISVIAYDNIAECQNCNSTESELLATIEKNDRLAGKTMVQTLIADIENSKQLQKTRIIKIPTTFIPRASLGFCKK